MSEEVKPHEVAFTAIAKHVTVTPQDERFLITVGHGLVDDPIYELYNTEQSANDTAHDLVSVLSVVIGDIMTNREQAAYERGKAEERARCVAGINDLITEYIKSPGIGFSHTMTAKMALEDARDNIVNQE